MTNLRDQNSRLNQWMNEKPSFDFGSELSLKKNDLVIFKFCSNGDDGDNLIKVYRSHVIEAISSKGSKYNKHIYCPAQSGEETPCNYCAQGQANVKERMSIWMAVRQVLHATMPPEKMFPQITHENTLYFNEEVNDFRIWNTSAWRESPWQDIVKLAELYEGLHNFTAQLQCLGDGLARRYKIYAVPRSETVSSELYEKAKLECEPIPTILHNQMGGAVAAAPPQQTERISTPIGVFAPSNVAAVIQPFAAPGVVIPSVQIPSLDNPTEGIPVAQEEDPKRPLKSLF